MKRAGGFFLWAATASRFISRGNAFANDQLQEVLSGVTDTSAPKESLDSIYLTVPDKVVSEDSREQERMELLSPYTPSSKLLWYWLFLSTHARCPDWRKSATTR